MFQLFRSLFSRTANLGGVTPDFQNELAVTGASSPVAVNTGAGLVYGIPYFNSASVNVVIATPGTSTRVDRIVLRASWAAKTVRITRIAGTEGAGTPAMTQTAGATWDVPLATVSITTGGVITVTDAREWLTGIGDATIDSTKLASAAVTYAKIQNVSVTDRILGRDTAGAGVVEEISPASLRTMINVADGANAYVHPAHSGDVVSVADGATTIQANAITTTKVIDDAITNAKLANDAVNTAEIVASAVSTAKIADDAVTNVKLANVATSTIKGRLTAATGDPEDLTATQARTVLNVSNGADVTETAISGATAKTTPVAADTFPLTDSAASNVIKKVTLTNLITAIGSPVASTNTYTPSLTYDSGTTGVTYLARVGNYIKINKLVFFQAEITLTNKGSGSGAALVSLPFTADAYIAAVTAVIENYTASGIAHPMGKISSSSTVVRLIDHTSATLTDILNGDLTNSSIILVSGTYAASS